MKKTPVGSCAIGRVAVVLIVTCMVAAAPRLFADITLVSRLSDARASASTMFSGSDNPPPQIQTDFLPANLSNSAMASGESGQGSGGCTSRSSIVVDNQMGTLQITGDGGANAGAFGGGGPASGLGSAKLIVLGFTLTDSSYSYSLSGQLSAQVFIGFATNSAATAKLAGPNGTIFEVVANAPPAVTLSQTGVLAPGNYTFSVDVNASAMSEPPPQPSSCASSANFNFALNSAPAPTPSPTGTPHDCGGTAIISGSVLYCSSPPPTATPGGSPTPTPLVSGVLISISSGFNSYSATTDATGQWGRTVLGAPPTSYTITPSNGPPLVPGSGNINTTDILAVQRHFLGISIIPGGCRLSAADAVSDGSINTSDVVAIQRFFLGLSTGVGSSGQYKFLPANRNVFVGDCAISSGNDFTIYAVGDVVAPFVN